MKLLYTTLLTFLGAFTLFAQKNPDLYQNVPKTPTGEIRCLTMEADAQSRALHPDRGTLEQFEQWLAPKIEAYKRERAENPNRLPPVLTIPVVVHVIHNGDAVGTGENISDAQVLSQIRVLNEDFRRMTGTPGFNTNPVGADVEVEFCMAQTDPLGNATNGIDRVNYGTASFNSTAAVDAMKTNTFWPPTEYLNMWTVRFGGGAAGLLGYAQFPDGSGLGGMPASGGAANTDGVVSTFDAFGSQAYAAGTYNPTYNLGRTMTHEVGHWVGLRHIWGDGNCGVDDFCNDTPGSDASNFGCPNTNSCADPAPDPRDMVENYMDYTDDACMNIFTNDQKTRIRTVFSVSPRRMELPSSTKCNPPAPIIGFTTDVSAINEGTDCGFQDVVLTLSIALAPSANATVTFTGAGTATGGGVDYDIFPASVVFPAGSTPTRNVTVRIYNDGLVEPNETVLIGMTLSTSGDALITTGDLKDHEITINDDDYAPSPSVTINVINADFNTGANGFTSTGNAGSDFFVLGTAATASSAFWTVENTNATQFAYTNDDRCNCNKNNDMLISPVFSLAGLTNATLTFDHAFADAVAAEVGEVRISTNGGGTWTTIQTLTNTSTALGGGAFSTPWVNGNSINLAAYLGQTNLRIAFRYRDGNGWNYGMAIDNVRIFSNTVAVIQEDVNSTNKDNIQVRANETVHWYDPVTDNVMGTIQNTSTWNYGCTTVEVDRSQATAGAATAPFWNAVAGDRLMAKTFYVDPASNNASGTYNVTFYFTDAEVSAWEAATGKSRNNLKIVKVANNPISAVNAVNYGGFNIEVIPATLGTFGTDVTLTASFSSGFSGFGFGDPTPPVILATELLSFKAYREVDDVRLQWSTETETNSSHFVLQRSSNGIEFEDLATIAAAGTSTSIKSYNYLDENPINGMNYYRLVQVDLDDNATKTAVISVDMTSEAPTPIVLAPNPVRNGLKVTFNTFYDGEVSMELFDVIGQKVMKTYNMPVQAGANSIHLDVRNFPQGIYLIRIVQGPRIYTERFVKG